MHLNDYAPNGLATLSFCVGTKVQRSEFSVIPCVGYCGTMRRQLRPEPGALAVEHEDFKTALRSETQSRAIRNVSSSQCNNNTMLWCNGSLAQFPSSKAVENELSNFQARTLAPAWSRPTNVTAAATTMKAADAASHPSRSRPQTGRSCHCHRCLRHQRRARLSRSRPHCTDPHAAW
jgi:hypothetical protein